MDQLFPAFVNRLDNDATLSGIVGHVKGRKNPEDPKKLTAPWVTVRMLPRGDRDVDGGPAEDVTFEVGIWGYGNAMYADCVRAARRIKNVLKGKRLTTSDGSQTLRIRSNGFDDIDQPDSDTVLLRARFTMGYWSKQTVDEIAS